MREKYLPIGSVVLLKDAEKELMIVGLSAISEDEPDQVFDYMGCLYPEGVVDALEMELFNHDQIDKILFVGYDTPKVKEYNEEVKRQTEEYLHFGEDVEESFE